MYLNFEIDKSVCGVHVRKIQGLQGLIQGPKAGFELPIPYLSVPYASANVMHEHKIQGIFLAQHMLADFDWLVRVLLA